MLWVDDQFRTSSTGCYGEYDFGALTVEGERIFFKIDYLDRGLTGHSPDPADATVTARVLTVMLAEEY